MGYKEFDAEFARLVAEMPVKFAFDDNQFKEIVSEWGLSLDDPAKLYESIVGIEQMPGAFCLRKDLLKTEEIADKLTAMMHSFLFDKRPTRSEELIEMFLDRMNEGLDDDTVLAHSGVDYKELYTHRHLSTAFKEAKKRYLNAKKN